MTRVKTTSIEVKLTASEVLDALIPLVEDLSRDLPERERYRRLLTTLRTLFPGDAAALLRLDDDTLVPLAIDGLTGDTLGRRFRVSDHPRFEALLSSEEPTRFPADSDMPDPYDGLVQGVSGHLEVHDCLGCPLLIGGRPWGLLTLDSLDPERFDTIDMNTLQAFLSLAAATVSVAERIDTLERNTEEERQRAEAYRQASGQSSRDLIGSSTAHQQLVNEIRVVANSDLTVLITGETGVGKELVANAIHTGSPRANKPMISLNCAALPDTLVESELFGHVRGAFSGASSDRRGKFELADGGTLFLDEVGELPLGVQAKLLRVLQNGQLQRIGSDSEHKVDVRLIAATNRDLAEEVRDGRFRADLYHRLSVYPLRVPPLRERGRDVLLLAGFFLEENRARLGLLSIRLGQDAQSALLSYNWPGNVRELEHMIGRSAFKALSRHRERPRILTLTAADLGMSANNGGELLAAAASAGSANAGDANVTDFRSAVTAYERTLVSDALERNNHNWAAVARALGMDRANLNRLAKRLGLK
ncbi:DNA-binding transcriptional dual regulator NorR [Paraburkholderia sabiae]|jgi:anaerobic nitric oxide reductase transcription regulator|uniref:nitric oxide reductase transcriptional regulator NorR n=1 Tax=Paraburkholderia sabiae TaxID=273251 RepID=UPI001CAD9559|nr:nitric oxide reductase transcriptional regulator NorR [Paraburkholderia sabiae]CAG9189621.1 DNA-binding transcriptional dual regulator NorR [Paraburkholderia sabiae]